MRLEEVFTKAQQQRIKSVIDKNLIACPIYATENQSPFNVLPTTDYFSLKCINSMGYL
ncbi:MAG: hypothetical protein ACFFAE_07415 [Candidatus Hodarchaeota archaeon]